MVYLSAIGAVGRAVCVTLFQCLVRGRVEDNGAASSLGKERKLKSSREVKHTKPVHRTQSSYLSSTYSAPRALPMHDIPLLLGACEQKPRALVWCFDAEAGSCGLCV